MAETSFRDRVIGLGGIAVNDSFFLSPPMGYSRMLFRNDGGEVLAITAENPLEAATDYLRRHPNPPVMFIGPPQ